MIKFSLIKRWEGRPLQCVLWCSLARYELILVPTSWVSQREKGGGVDKPWEVRNLLVVLVGLGGGFGQWWWLSYPRALSVLGTNQRSCSSQPPWAEAPIRYSFNLHPLKISIHIGIGGCILSFWCVLKMIESLFCFLIPLTSMLIDWVAFLAGFELLIPLFCGHSLWGSRCYVQSVCVCVGGYCLMDYEGFGWS
jgi:hypothetical protein